ncbi:Integrin-linked kinase-associated serine/threonine phosphatase 2C, partial [Stegodyphus mimosarum]
MDLFEDLPEPERNKDSTLPESKVQNWDNVNMGFFLDLPLPSSTSSEVRGVKRKLNESDPDSSVNDQAEELYDVQGYYAEKKGEREEMQDCHVLINDFHKHVPQLHPSVSRLSYYAVFDGHGGN